MYQKLIVAPQRAWMALATALVLAVIHQYLFCGHAMGVSYPVFVILFYLYMYTHGGDRLRPGSAISRLLMTAIVLLSLTYALFANPLFSVLNLLAVPVLIVLHTTYMLSERRPAWSSAALGWAAVEQVLVHMFAHVPTPIRMLYHQLAKRMEQERRRTLGRILIGVVTALPLLVVVLLLLTSADRMFDELLSNLPSWFVGLTPGPVLFRIAWIGVMMLVIFAYLWGFVRPLHRDPLSGRYISEKDANVPYHEPLSGEIEKSSAQAGQTEDGGTTAYKGQPRSERQTPYERPIEHERQTEQARPIEHEQQAGYGGQSQSKYGKLSQHTEHITTAPSTPAILWDAPIEPLRLLRLDPIVAATILVLVNLVYMLFVWLQFSYLFGAGQGRLPDGSTYAEYARSGFGELVIVTAINFTLLLSVLYTSAPARSLLMKVNRWLLYILVICSAVMLSSAFTRLVLYEQAYGYTVTRLLVHIFMLFLGVLLLLAGLRIRFSRLPLYKCFLILGLSVYVVLNYAGMESWIAERNIERYAESGQIDQDYLIGLSADAVPILLEFADQHPQLGLTTRLRQSKQDLLEQDHSWQAFNWSIYRAARELR
ncbi:DUF4153 domain-containing protein [Paenibacillus wenxiniae]|uniref:DUF4173 domain-containing protein n=1 Tax=Paenibacillus wenxiniae TaxID=1636843 RepID=A0ABW4RET8_9BACL